LFFKPNLMECFKEQLSLARKLDLIRKEGKSIGLVPTMGALHEGHATLIKNSKKDNDVTIVTIFVNPKQFNNAQDFLLYPSTLESDKKLLQDLDCDILFHPDSNSIYNKEPAIIMAFPSLENTMEGAFRAGHFQGIALIVSKLFNIIAPTRAYFGQKDFQQCAIITQLIADLSFQIEMVIVPTVRENNGLALSSRNLRLTPAIRVEATLIYKSLKNAQTRLLNGVAITKVKNELTLSFQKSKTMQLEYFSIVDSITLADLTKISEKQTSLCIAAFAGDVRLIDNIYLHE
jgi:pantoate--beta-alanine ligase